MDCVAGSATVPKHLTLLGLTTGLVLPWKQVLI